MKSRLSVSRRDAASTGAVPSASAVRSCSIACARSSKRSKLRLTVSGRPGPIAFSTAGRRGQQPRRRFANAAPRPAARSAPPRGRRARPATARAARASRAPRRARARSARSAAPTADLPASISSITRSSRARDAASASKAGAEPRTAAPACSGMFCASAVSDATCSRSCACCCIARPESSRASAASSGRRRAPRRAARAAGGRRRIDWSCRHPSCRFGPAAHEAAACRNCGLSSSVRTLNTGQTSAPRLNAPAR